MSGLFRLGKPVDQRVVSRVLAPTIGMIGRMLMAASSYSRASCMCNELIIVSNRYVKVVPASIKSVPTLANGGLLPLHAYQICPSAASRTMFKVGQGVQAPGESVMVSCSRSGMLSGLRTGFSTSSGDPERQEALLDRPGAGLQHCRFQSQHICLAACSVCGLFRWPAEFAA